MPDPNYLDYVEGKHEREGTGRDPSTDGTPDGNGWVSRTLPDGSTEWRPAGEVWAPPGWIWAMDDAGFPIMGAGGRKRYNRVPKLKEIGS
jgi:hypothetical protein